MIYDHIHNQSTNAMKIRTIPQEYEAIQWNVNNRKEVVDYFNGDGNRFGFSGDNLYVFGAVGQSQCKPGDWGIYDDTIKQYRVVDQDTVKAYYEVV